MHDSFWAVSTTGVAAGPTFNLRAGGTSFGTIEAGAAGLLDLRMSTSAGVVGTHGAATGGPDYRVNRTAVAFASLANNYHVASTDPVNTPLPIQLISFSGEVVDNGVRLNWETASELRNDFFTIERSPSGEAFSSIGKVKGAGTTSQSNGYSLIDRDPIFGKGYYRLKQTDFDGTATYSKIIFVTFEKLFVPVMDVYPNPSRGDQFTVRITGLKNAESVPVVIYDQLGREILRFMMNVGSDAEFVDMTLSQERTLPAGIYLLKAGSSPIMTRKLVIAER